MPEDDGIPRFDCNKLVIKDHIGHGSFGDVFIADYQAPGKDSKETVIVKKNDKRNGCRGKETLLIRSSSVKWP